MPLLFPGIIDNHDAGIREPTACPRRKVPGSLCLGNDKSIMPSCVRTRDSAKRLLGLSESLAFELGTLETNSSVSAIESIERDNNSSVHRRKERLFSLSSSLPPSLHFSLRFAVEPLPHIAGCSYGRRGTPGAVRADLPTCSRRSRILPQRRRPRSGRIGRRSADAAQGGIQAGIQTGIQVQ